MTKLLSGWGGLRLSTKMVKLRQWLWLQALRGLLSFCITRRSLTDSKPEAFETEEAQLDDKCVERLVRLGAGFVGKRLCS